MAKKHWIAGAVPKSHEGIFSAKAKRAGMSTSGTAQGEQSRVTPPNSAAHGVCPVLARLRHAVMSARCRLSGANRTRCAHFELSRSWPVADLPTR